MATTSDRYRCSDRAEHRLLARDHLFAVLARLRVRRSSRSRREEQQAEDQRCALVLIAEDRDDRGGDCRADGDQGGYPPAEDDRRAERREEEGGDGVFTGAVTIAPTAATARMTAPAMAAGRLALPDNMDTTVSVRTARELWTSGAREGWSASTTRWSRARTSA